MCVDAGVDAVGFNLWPGSPRHRTVDHAGAIMRAAGDLGAVLRVGVFVDPSENELRLTQRALNLDYVQLHGDRPIEDYAALGFPYIWVIRGTPELSSLHVPEPAPAWILLDARVPEYGGAGRTTDWAWAAQAVGHLAPIPVWLAGGITPQNAAMALAQVRPAGLDVASGAEFTGAAQGEKDPAKVAALMAICKNGGRP